MVRCQKKKKEQTIAYAYVLPLESVVPKLILALEPKTLAVTPFDPSCVTVNYRRITKK